MTTRELAILLRTLERHYGAVTWAEPEDPYELIVSTHCGYPPSQEICRRTRPHGDRCPLARVCPYFRLQRASPQRNQRAS